jgi:hypothetical protein
MERGLLLNHAPKRRRRIAMGANRTYPGLLLVAGLAGLALAGGCTPMVTGQMAEGGFSAAKSALGALSPTAAGADERQKRMQAALNETDIGDDVQPVLEKMGEPPREKSGNAQGYTCYEFPSVYSATDAAVLMAREGRIVFYGNSRCTQEMDVANFRVGGKHAPLSSTQYSN